jgi:integrase
MPAVHLNSVDTHLTFAARRRAAGSGPETIGQYLSYLHALMKVARHVWRLDIDPAAVTEARSALSMVNAVAKGNTRNRRPTAEELERLFTYWGGRNDLYLPMVDITRFAVASAMRLGEIVSLRWDDLDHDDRTVLIRDRKHPTEKLGNDQVVPMFTEAWQIAMRQPQTREQIFPYGRQRISDNWRRSTRACGIKDLRFHDLRHEGTSRLFEAGYQIHEVAIVTGHRDWSSLKRYTQIHARDLHRD